MAKERRGRRAFSAEFKVEAVRRAEGPHVPMAKPLDSGVGREETRRTIRVRATLAP